VADRSVKYVLSANTSGFVGGMKMARTAVRELNVDLAKNGQSAESFMAKYEQSARDVTTGLGLVGAAAVAGAGLAIKTYADFDKQMSAVKATGGATAAELGRLRDAAIEAGAKTSFSATEAAAGVENLLKAGVSAQDVLGGGLNGTLDLAASGALSVADAAEIAAGAMTQFKLGGEDVTHIADLLAAGAGKAQGGVADLAGALKYAGVPVAQLGVSLEETTGTLALFASNAIVGEQAGTSLRSMVSSLTSPSKLAASEMERLGISVFDGQDKFVGLAGVAGQLQSRMSGLSDAERAAALGRIFGNESLQAANVLYDGGAEAVQKWTAAVDDQGYAAKTAAARLDNLHGDLEGLGGALESLMIRSGSGGNDFLRGMTQGATDLVNVLGQIDGSVLSGLTLALGAGGTLALGAAGAGKLAIGLNNANTALKELGTSWKTVGKAAAVGGGLVGVAAIGLQVWAQEAATARSQTDEYIATLDSLGQVTDATMRTLSTRLSEDQGNWVQDIFGKNPGSILDQAKEIGVATETVQAAILGNKQAYEEVTSAAERYAATNEARVADTMLNSSQYAEQFTAAIDEQSGRLSDAQKEQAQKAEADRAAGTAQAELQANYATTTGAIDEQVASLADLIEAQQKAAGVVLDEREARRQYQEQLDAAKKSLEENGETLDITTEKGRANQEVLDGISEKALAVASSMEANGKSQEKVQGVIKRARKDYIDMATDMGVPIEKARALADSLGLIPGNYVADASVNTAAAETALRDFLTKLESANGTITIKGDGAPAERKLDEVTTQVNEADGSVTIRAKDGKAIATLSDYTAKVDESDGTVTIKGKDKQGRETVLKLTSWVGDQGSAIKVDADTSDAKDKIGKLRKQVLQLPDKKITVTADTRVTGPGMTTGGLPWGDGEGAGWSGKLPRGVGQMSQAVKAMDPTARITSGYRPGAVTATGYPSFHGMNRAVDIVSADMGRTWDMLRSAFGTSAKELYYTPRGFIRNGHLTNDVAAVTRRTHRSHVHLALASGGRLPGASPADPHEDNLLGVDEHGMPMARVRSREWVVNQPASDYYGDGLMGAINSRRIPRDDLAAALPGLAGGGAVGTTERALKTAEARRDAAARKVREAREAVKRARKTKKDADDRAAEKRLDKAEADLERRKEEVSKQRERLSTLRSDRTEIGRDLRRGNLLDSATSGADGAYGVVDEMVDLARSGNLSKSQSNRLAKQAGRAETAMRGLYREVDKVDKRLESAAGRVEKLQGISDSVKNALAGEQKLEVQAAQMRDVVRTNSRGETWTEQMWDAGGTSAKSLLSAATSKAAGLRAFAGKLSALRKAGLSGVLLEEIAGLGSVEGAQVADALLADKGAIKDLNQQYRVIDYYAGKAGQYVTEGYEKGGLSAAKAFEAGLERQKASLEKRVYNWGVVMANAVSQALTGKGTSLKKRASGGPVSAGEMYRVNELGTETFVPNVNGYILTADQTRRLATSTPTVTASSQTVHTGPLVQVTVKEMVTADVDRGVRELRTQMTDAIYTHGLDRLVQGVGA